PLVRRRSAPLPVRREPHLPLFAGIRPSPRPRGEVGRGAKPPAYAHRALRDGHEAPGFQGWALGDACPHPDPPPQAGEGDLRPLIACWARSTRSPGIGHCGDACPHPDPPPASGGGRAASSDCVLGAKRQACRGLGTAAGLAPTPTPPQAGEGDLRPLIACWARSARPAGIGHCGGTCPHPDPPPQAGEGDLRPLIAGESPFSVYAGDSPFPLSAGDPRHFLFAGSRTSHCSRVFDPPPVNGGRLGGGAPTRCTSCIAMRMPSPASARHTGKEPKPGGLTREQRGHGHTLPGNGAVHAGRSLPHGNAPRDGIQEETQPWADSNRSPGRSWTWSTRSVTTSASSSPTARAGGCRRAPCWA